MNNVILLLISISLLFYGCFTNTAECDTKDKSYNELINEAELSISIGDREKALHYYKVAFSKDKYINIWDINNALLSAVEQQEYKVAMTYAQELVKKGIELSFFNRSFFDSFRRDEEWSSFVASYNKLREEYQSRVDTKLREEMETLYRKDQYLFCGKGIEPSLERTNYEILDSIFQAVGYPTEDDIGAFVKEDTMLTYLPQNVIIRHYYQSGKTQWSSFLTQEMQKGKIKPEQLAYWLEEDVARNSLVSYMPYVVNIFGNKKYRYKISDSRREQINHLRKEIQMHTLEEQEKKVLFMWDKGGKDKGYRLSIYGGVADHGTQPIGNFIEFYEEIKNND